MTKHLSFALALALVGAAAAGAADVEIGDDVDVTAGAVVALSCAIEIQKTNNLDLLTACPLSETKSGFVIYDVAEQTIYELTGKKIAQFELASAFGGGSIDFTGKVKKVDKKTGIVTVVIDEYTIAKKKKAGGFKGCL